MLKETRIKRVNENGNLYEYLIEKRFFGIKIYNYHFKSNCQEEIKNNVIPNKIGYKL